jgi:uncharacterized protein YhaN
MRLARLDLARYGKFTDQTLDFGSQPPDGPDFHIVYGLNEAGKSTTFAAYLDLLFGIPERSGYNFLHPYNTMKIGARLEFGGAAHELVRLKQRSGSLVDERGQPVNEALLSSALGGIGRDAYRTMFSLDDQSLKDGGNAIIQSRGELGELLFSASSGLAGLSKSLTMAAEDAASLYKKRSSATKLAELKRSLEALRGERNAIDTFATAYAALTATFTQARAAYDTATGELAQAKLRHQALTRILAALPLAAELARLAADPASQGELPRPPAEWFALLPQLSRDETRLQALIEAADRGIKDVSVEIDAIAIDEVGLAIGDQIEALDNGRARYRAAESDLPKRRLALAEQEGALTRLLAELEQSGHPAADSLLLPAATTGILRDLIEKRSGIEAQLAAAEREVRRAGAALERLTAAGMAAGEPMIDADQADRIEAALARLKASDLAARLGVETRMRAQRRRALEARLADLLPWSDGVDALAALPETNTRQIEAWRAQATAIDKRIAEHQGRLRDLVTEDMLTSARLGALSAGGAIDDMQALALRAARDAAWQAHLAGLDPATASAFEEKMRQDDSVSASRLARANDLAELRQLTQAAAATAAGLARQRQLLDEAEAEHAALSARIGALLPDHLTEEAGALDRLAALEAWSLRRNMALAARDEREQADAEIEAIEADLDRLGGALADALFEAGIDTVERLPVPDLARAASDLLAQAQTSRANAENRQKALDDLARDLAERERDQADALADADAWQRAWTAALAGTWLAGKAQSVAAVRAILTVLAGLPAALGERHDLAQRIAAMERDQAQFCDELDAILAPLGAAVAIEQPLAAANAIIERHRAARRDHDMRAGKQAELARLAAERQRLEQELAIHDARKRELTAYFGTDTLAAVGEFLEQARERQRIETRMADLSEQVVQTLRVASQAEAEQLLAGIDANEVEREAAELSTRIDDLTERARLLYAEMSRAGDRLDAVGGDDAVARIEARRRTVLLEIEALAIRYLTLRSGTLAAEQALHIYREKHRSSMMNRASEAFRTITGGSYSGLATQPDKDREILIGVGRDGGSKLADAMSTGTQFQLYLALRLAGYEEFAAVRPAIPFVADDIMESFDNPRSEEVFRLLGQMADVGQVIYLTHHWHLCEIARAVVPGVRIHELG